MTVNAVDATGLSPSQITTLARNGVKTVGRYLSHSSWKALNLGEVANLKAAGMQIFSIYESNPTRASYFTAAKGKSDALDAIALAKAIGQPANTAIYFTVDYDAQAADFPAILAYFKAVKANLVGYKVGAYGSFTVLNYLHQNKAADYWFQTVAWSNGQRCSFLNIYQFQCDKTLAGVGVDFDNLETADIGAWGNVQPAKTDIKPIVTTKGAWKKENSIWYYYEGSKKRIGWIQDAGKWYYLKEGTGQMVVGWYKVAGTWYYFDVHGVMQTGWITDKGKKYYLDTKGKMVTGRQVIDGKTYTFNTSGALQ